MFWDRTWCFWRFGIERDVHWRFMVNFYNKKGWNYGDFRERHDFRENVKVDVKTQLFTTSKTSKLTPNRQWTSRSISKHHVRDVHWRLTEQELTFSLWTWCWLTFYGDVGWRFLCERDVFKHIRSLGDVFKLIRTLGDVFKHIRTRRCF